MLVGRLAGITQFILGTTLLAACGGPSGPVPNNGLAVWIDGAQIRTDAASDLARRPTDYNRGGLSGWHVFGTILPRDERDKTARLEIIASNGQRLAVAQPARLHPDLEPVVWVDRDGDLRFAMHAADDADGIAHGRGPGDGRGRGNRVGRGQLTLGKVVQVRMLRQDALAAQAMASKAGASAAGGGAGGGGGGGGDGRGRRARPATPLVLKIGAHEESTTADALAAKLRGDDWPLRRVIESFTTGAVKEVVVVASEGQRRVIDAATWKGDTRLDLRLNRRGQFKFESPLGQLRDVARIDVTLE